MPESLCHVQSEVYREEASFQCVEIDFRDIQGKLGISCVRDIKKGEFQLKKKKATNIKYYGGDMERRVR